MAHNALKLLEVDPRGLDRTDRKLLLTLIEKFNGGPVGLGTLAAAISEETETLEDVYEPFLLQIVFPKMTPRGRTATMMAYEHLNLEFPREK